VSALWALGGTAPAATEDVVHRDRTASKEDQSEGERGGSEREFESMVPG
jgi:hypothetical protein